MFWMDLGPSVQLFYSPSPVKPWTWLISSLHHRLLIDPVSNLQLCSFSLSPVGWYPLSEMLSCSGVSHCSWLGSCHGMACSCCSPTGTISSLPAEKSNLTTWRLLMKQIVQISQCKEIYLLLHDFTYPGSIQVPYNANLHLCFFKKKI